MSTTQFLNKQFQKIYVLTLERLTERHAQIAQQLDGLNYELFFGLDKETVDLHTEEKKGNYNNEAYLKLNKDGSQMRLGAYCCAYGHRAIYEDMQKNNIQSAFIMEDDVLMNNIDLQTLQNTFDELPANWELFYLGYEKNEHLGFIQKLKRNWYQLFPGHSLLKMKAFQYKKYYATPLSKHIKNAGFHDCTHAYAITLQGAQKIINLQSPIQLKSDTALSFAVTLNKVIAYIAIPKIFDQLSIKENSIIKSLVSD